MMNEIDEVMMKFFEHDQLLKVFRNYEQVSNEFVEDHITRLIEAIHLEESFDKFSDLVIHWHVDVLVTNN